MLCDEWVRSLPARQPGSQPRPDLRRAELTRVSGCPARLGFRELHFSVAGQPWSWCFPPAGQDAAAASRLGKPVSGAAGLVLRPGPHGLLAEPAAGAGQPGPAADRIDLAAAADLAVSGAAVFVHDSLVRQGSADDVHDGRRPAAGREGAAR